MVKQPLVITFHNPISKRHIAFLLRVRKRKLSLCGVSRAHIKDVPEGPWTTVYNAANANLYPYSGTPRRPPYLLYSGRISPLKGTHIAIEVARKCGLELIIAGNVSKEPGGPEYFRDRIAPELNHLIRWIGEVTDAEKAALYGGALALLVPIDWPEPFGLVMIESMLCGTPVIAFDCGSVPEIIEHGKTGYVVVTAEQMAAAVNSIDRISRAECARVARERYSAPVMVDEYLRIYKSLLTDNRAEAPDFPPRQLSNSA
jgi:glycosyltransferase involved in cell wall biosynthesis